MATRPPTMPAHAARLAEATCLPQIGDDLVGRIFRRNLIRIDAQLRVFRRLIGAVETGEILDLTRLSLLVEPSRVALDADLERGRRRLR